mgnify:FL=1
MKITLNPDKETVKTVKEGLKRTGGYCPCRIQRTEEYKCMCKEFKEQIADPDFEAFVIVCFTTNLKIKITEQEDCYGNRALQRNF